MGFGILLFGYFLAFASNLYTFADNITDAVRLYGFAAEIIGALVMICASKKLAEYNLYYKSAIWAETGFLLLSGVSAADIFLGLWDDGSVLGLAVVCVKLAVALIIHVLVFLGIRGIALGADDVPLSKVAERQLVMTAVYFVASSCVLGIGERFLPRAYFTLALLIYWLVCYILNLLFIYKCFGKLYPEEEDQTVPRRSSIGLVNKLNDKFDSLDKKADSYRMASAAAARKEAEKKSQTKKKNSHTHKKKKKK